jgi:nitrous oxidase accessory protein
MPVAAAVLAIVLGQGGMAALPAGEMEGRPSSTDASPLQALLDAAPEGATVEVGPGTYVGDLAIERPLRLVGRGRPRLVGSGKGSVVRVRAPDVVVEGFDIDGRKGGDLGRDAAGVHVAAPRVTVRDCRIENALFGIYLRAADGALVESNVVRGIREKSAGEKGSGIHVWNTDGFRLERNVVFHARDGFYIEQSPHGAVRHNVARELRYCIHYMFSNDNVFEDNLFETSDAGGVLMYSRRIVFRRNRFLHNRGYASVGLLFKACDDSIAEDNLLADNARGIFLEHSFRNVFRRNAVIASDQAVIVYQSAGQNRFEGNAFVDNLSSFVLVGRRTDTAVEGNFWSDHDAPDLDGDGRADLPYVVGSLFDHFRENVSVADLVARSPAAAALAAAERTFPVLDAIGVRDPSPLARAPRLAALQLAERGRGERGTGGIAASALATISALTVLGRARRRGAAP